MSNARISSQMGKMSDFYYSKEWKIVRYAVLRNSNGWCRLCGRTAKDGIKLHVDHIIPISKIPRLALRIDNLQVLCEDCNIGKSNTDNINWETHIELTKKQKKRLTRNSMRLLERCSTARNLSTSSRDIIEKEKKEKKRKAENLTNPSSNNLCVKQVKIILRKGTTT